MMDHEATVSEPVAGFAAACLNAPAETLQIEARPLRGGLVSRSVQWVSASSARRGRCAFVAKRLDGPERREARIHSALMATPARALVPALLGVHEGGAVSGWLFLEAVQPAQPWPWSEVERAGDVLRALVRLHALDAGSLARDVGGWDYEQELGESGRRLIEVLASRQRELRALGLANPVWFVRGFVERLGAARRRMLTLPEMPPSVIHGDVHSGNVLLGVRRARAAPVLLDWGRARIGSPLEDVSSWLQSLGFWEPCARQRHDTLLRTYLSAREQRWPPTPALRAAYWVAAACNGIAGAAEWHLHRATDPTLGARERAQAAAALRDQLRLLRRAYEYECVMPFSRLGPPSAHTAAPAPRSRRRG